LPNSVSVDTGCCVNSSCIDVSIRSSDASLLFDASNRETNRKQENERIADDRNDWNVDPVTYTYKC